MQSKISGSYNEFEFVKYLNGKKISELNPLFRELIDELFPLQQENSIIKSWRNHYNQKSDREIVIEYLKYQYADGSTNGKGLKRLSVEEYKKKNQCNIDKINKAINNEKILKEAIERFVIKGNNSDYYIDAIICGEVNDFVWATRRDIQNIILSKKDIYSIGDILAH